MTDLLPPAVLDLVVNTAQWVTGLGTAAEALQMFRAEMETTITAMGTFAETIDTSAVEAAATLSEAYGRIAVTAQEASAAMGETAAAARASAAAQEEAAAAATATAEKSAVASNATKASAGGFSVLGSKAFLAAAAVVGVGVAGIKMSADYDSVTTRLVTSAGEQLSALNTVKQGMLTMAGQVGVSAQDLAKAMYYVESAGYHAGDGLKVLQAAAQGAKAEGADTTQVAKALTDVLVDYHLPATAAATVTSQMIAAVANGKTSLQDFSAAFASIIPVAAASGISFQDVGSALAEMTNHGFTAQRASQNLAQALRSLQHPTKPMLAAFAEFGVSTKELTAKLDGPNGLTDAMQYVAKAAMKAGPEGTTQFKAALQSLMGTAAGSNAAIATTGENFAATAHTIQAMSHATADAQGNVKGFAEIQGTLNQRMAEAKAAGQSLMITLGNMLMPVLTHLATLFAGAANAVMGFINVFENSGPLKAIAVAIGAIILVMKVWAITTKMVSVAMGILNAVMDANPIVLIVLAIAGLVAAFVYLWNTSAGFRKFWEGLWNGIKAVFSAVIDWIVNAFHAVVGFFEKWGPLILAVLMPFIGIPLLIIQHWGDIVKFFESLPDKIGGFISDMVKKVLSFFAALPREIGYALGYMIGTLVRIGLEWGRAFLQAIVTAFHAVVGFFEDLPKNIASFVADSAVWLVTTGQHLIVGLWNGLVAAAVAVWNWFGNLPGYLMNLTASAAIWLVTTGKNILVGIVRGIGEAASAVWNWFLDLPHNILNALGDAAKWLFNVGVDILKGLWDGIKSAMSWLWNQIKSFASGIINGFKSALGISSPSKLMADNVGVHITRGIAQGMMDGMPHVHSAIASIRDTVTGGNYGAGSFGLGSLGGVNYATLGTGGGNGVLVINNNIQGTVVGETQLSQVLRTQVLQYNQRNPTNGLSLFGRGNV